MPKISTIEKAAKLAAYHSKAKYSSHVPVDYCFVKFVKKPKGSVPGYVIYSNNKTIYVDP
jgi:predicted ribosome quality control (RQC) complex YloA/Tae2 family protein